MLYKIKAQIPAKVCGTSVDNTLVNYKKIDLLVL